jgi:hypothetical protein
MNQSLRLLCCIALIGLGIAPVGQAQNARSSRVIIIREAQPHYRGRSHYPRRPHYRGDRYYRRFDPRDDRGVIIRIEADDYCEDCSRFYYRRGRGETYPDREVYPSRDRRYDRDRYDD